jgi:hypothetical protein
MLRDDRIAALEMRVTEARLRVAQLERIESELRSLEPRERTEALLRSNADLLNTCRMRLARIEDELGGI